MSRKCNDTRAVPGELDRRVVSETNSGTAESRKRPPLYHFPLGLCSVPPASRYPPQAGVRVSDDWFEAVVSLKFPPFCRPHLDRERVF